MDKNTVCLELRNIVKKYKVADSYVEALKGINLAFRKNEFVSILGPSGCGKTTTLNIIGGLDKYTSGDLLINGKSTKNFSEHDWDNYRNKRIGFVFQSYNLIPHQTILGNVELSLTIAGVSKEERQERAKKALDKVGLAGQYHKKPNQLSGGQCQRVAIARALVNEPEILLADEPTGALDTKTSVQIMDLIKEIAKERLVIMVTHNPELAEQYSTRIIKLLDGELQYDSNPLTAEEMIYQEEVVTTKKERSKMSWWTAFKLSSKNLLSKFKRTILVCIAGSIGIVGISSVLGVSSGVTGYIESMQDDMLSGNPITISENSYDINALINSMNTNEKFQVAIKEGFVNVDSLIQYFAAMATGDDSFIIDNTINQDYIDYINAMPKEYYNAINYKYGMNMGLNIYTDFTNTKDETLNTSLTALQLMVMEALRDTDYSNFVQILEGMSAPLYQTIPNEEYVLSQYDLKAGKIATEKNEIMIVVNHKSQLTDIALAQLGYYTQQEFFDLALHADNPTTDDKWEFSYEELMAKKFYYYPNDIVYSQNDILPGYPNPLNPFTYNPYSDSFDKNQGLELSVVGILEPKDDIMYGSLSSGFYYTEDLSKYMLESAKDSKLVAFGNENANEDGDFYFGMETTIQEPIPGFPDLKPGQKVDLFSIDYTINYVDFDGNEKVSIGNLKSLSSGMMGIVLPGMSGGSLNIYGPSIREVGGRDIPNSIAIYPLSFDDKGLVTDYLDKWNSDEDIELNGKVLTPEDRYDITYNDNLEVIINMINGLINMITIALICFTALSLVVSCVMIAIITYVSVMERYKEIGVIRALGGRKRDVSNLFNAETITIGAASGLIGLIVTYSLALVANLIVRAITGIYPISALPITQALIMLIISIILTTISGFIPARSAAKKDPVNALRSE